MTDERVKMLALRRANEIIEAWWDEDVWDYAEYHELTEEQMEQLMRVPFKIVLVENK